MEMPASQIAHRLGQQAEAVCRHYLSKGCREGRYWLVGDVRNQPGRSLYVRLVDMEKGRAGKWTDAATGQHGDLLDIIALSHGYHRLCDTLEEARRFLSLPAPELDPDRKPYRPRRKATAGSTAAALRLWAAARPLTDSTASAYLKLRSIVTLRDSDPLRAHASCFYRPGKDDAPHTPTAWPAMIALVTDLHGNSTGVHRTWLDPLRLIKAPIASPRRAMGHILGHAIRFGRAEDVLIAGEGLETMLSLREALPQIPLVAATSSAHLAAILLPHSLKRLYVARDNDPAGKAAVGALSDRADPLGIEVIPLVPLAGDFNDDLQQYGAARLKHSLIGQLYADDIGRFG